jgi:hypothetical protein
MGPRHRIDPLAIAMLAYFAASLMHFAHNAVYIEAYPYLPDSLTPARVWAAWFAEAALGAAGYLVLSRGLRVLGLLLIALWAALGFDGLAHYSLAPVSAHSLTMNLTIWIEVLAASVLLVAVIWQSRRSLAPSAKAP